MSFPSIKYGLVIALTCFSSGSAIAYLPVTHAEISSQAWKKFINLSTQQDILFRLGIWAPDAQLGTNYVDVKNAIVATRPFDMDYEGDIIGNELSNLQSVLHSPQGYLMAGSIREDDNPHEKHGNFGDQINGDFDREFNHFYDPTTNRELHVVEEPQGSFLTGYYSYETGGASIRSAPNWAMGTDSLDAEYTRGSDSLNHFTLFDAREYMWRALTGVRYIDRGSITLFGDKATEKDRLLYWAAAFRALGDVLHLNEDMAQPQHTRNEPHTGTFQALNSTRLKKLFGEKSEYEEYTATRTRKNVSPRTTPALVTEIPEADGSSWPYPVPKFKNYRDYWTNQAGPPGPGGKGLADFSNREFFTAGNNPTVSSYSSPATNVGGFVADVVPVTLPSGRNANKLYYATHVHDYNQADPNPAYVKLTGTTTVPGTYFLDNTVYTAIADQLIPRAISYSAGILDHFFRGQLQISRPQIGVYSIVDHAAQYASGAPPTDPNSTSAGFTKIRATVKNASPGDDDVMSHGTLTAVLRFRRNATYQDTLVNDPNAPSRALTDGVTRNLNEEVAVSTSVYSVTSYNADGSAQLSSAPVGTTGNPVSLAKGAQQEFEFHFGESQNSIVLPLNATDVYLQIIYRGQLGSGDDADAMVVGTLDLSEPTYVNIYNGSEYIIINHQTYTRVQVVDNQSLLALVDPGCTTGSAGARVLNGNCFNPVAMTASFDPRDPTYSQPLIKITGLLPTEYSQVVLLTDTPKSIAGEGPLADVGGIDMANKITFDGDPNDCKSSANPARWVGTLNEVQYLPPYTAPARRPNNVPTLAQGRGILLTNASSCLWNGDTNPPAADDRYSVMSLFPAGAYPKPVTLGF